MTEDKTMRPTVVTFLLDETMSMAEIKSVTLEGMNSYISTLKEQTNPVTFSLVKFNQYGVTKVYASKPISEVGLVGDADYSPKGGTPLIDAAYKTIEATERAVARRDDDPIVIVVIQTDGDENCSTQHTTEALKSLISRKTEENWSFVFMGAGINAYKTAVDRLGIDVANTVSYSGANTKQAFGSLSASTTANMASGGLRGMGFSAVDKQAMGDEYIGKYTTEAKDQPSDQIPKSGVNFMDGARRINNPSLRPGQAVGVGTPRDPKTSHNNWQRSLAEPLEL